MIDFVLGGLIALLMFMAIRKAAKDFAAGGCPGCGKCSKSTDCGKAR